MKKSILRGFGVTLFVFLAMWGVSGISHIQLFSAFDPISQALGEFELTDYVFSKLRPDPVPDSRIVLVNIGPSRREIGQQIQIISQHKPGQMIIVPRNMRPGTLTNPNCVDTA